MIQQGNSSWADRLTKKEVAKFIEHLVLSAQGTDTDMNSQVLIRVTHELSHGNKNWADRVQKGELIQIAESLITVVQGQQEFGGTQLGGMQRPYAGTMDPMRGT